MLNTYSCPRGSYGYAATYLYTIKVLRYENQSVLPLKNVVFLTLKRVIGRYVSCRTVQPSFTQHHTHAASGDVRIRWSCGSQAVIRAKSTTPEEIDSQCRCWMCHASRGRRRCDAPPSLIQRWVIHDQTSVSNACRHILQRKRLSPFYAGEKWCFSLQHLSLIPQYLSSDLSGNKRFNWKKLHANVQLPPLFLSQHF